MEEVALIPIEEAATATVKSIVEQLVEGTVKRGVTSAVDASIQKIITDMIATTMASEIMAEISVKNMTGDIIQALDGNLAQSTKDILGECGMRMVAESISSIPSREVTKTLYRSINNLLWVFHDADFVRMERFVRFIHALERGAEPPKEEDPEPEEEGKCRIPELYSGSVGNDILGFMVFNNEECEGGVVNGFGVEWNKLLKLIDDPVGGSTVVGLLSAIFDRYPLDETSKGSGLVMVAKPTRRVGLKVLNFNLVSLGNTKINNVHGSAVDKLVGMTWIAFWKYAYKGCPLGQCNIETESPKYDKPHNPNKRVLGGHVWRSTSVGGKSYYILPICSSHNARVKWDYPPTYMITKPNATAVKIAALKEVVDKTKVLKTKLKKGPSLMLFSASGAATAEVNPSMGAPTGGSPSLDPFQQWLKPETFKLAKKFSAGPIETVTKQITREVLSKVGQLIQDAGSEALNWLSSEGKNIMLMGLIPIYGEIQTIVRLSSLKSDTMKKFKDNIQKSITTYSSDIKGEKEQERRRGLLNSETQKLVESPEWKSALFTFEDKVRDWVQKNIRN